MPKSILEAIKQGMWEFEPQEVDSSCFDATGAMPGTPDKLKVLADRVQSGLPLWHPEDRGEMDEPILAKKPR